MIAIDTSAWIEFLRDTGSPTCEAVDRLLDSGIAITDAVSMEVLAGARDDIHLQSLRRLLARASVLPTTPSTYEHAAMLYRACRRNGETVRKLIDCLIAAATIEQGASLLHRDADFGAIARHTSLVLAADDGSR